MTITERAEQLVEGWYGQPRSLWDFPVTDLYSRIVDALNETIEQCACIADTHERDAQHDFLRATDSADRMKISGRVEAASQIATAIRDIL